MLKYLFFCIIAAPFFVYATGNDYDVHSFRANYHTYKIGDVAPDINFTNDYVIDSWAIRHLPAPEANTFWSYMDGTYVLLRKSDHKIIAAKSSDIFYRRMVD